MVINCSKKNTEFARRKSDGGPLRGDKTILSLLRNFWEKEGTRAGVGELRRGKARVRGKKGEPKNWKKEKDAMAGSTEAGGKGH